jgi:hypothetical protein
MEKLDSEEKLLQAPGKGGNWSVKEKLLQELGFGGSWIVRRSCCKSPA